MSDRDEIIRMAREAGFNVEANGAINDGIETAADFSAELKRFAVLASAEFRKDAERYRWLRVQREAYPQGAALDAAIDAAMDKK